MYIGIFSLNKKINILYRILTGTYFGEDDESIGRLLWNDVNFQQKSVFIILRYLLMGIKAIKSVEAGLNLKPDPIFDLQSMIKIRHEPITNYYTFSKKLGSGTYGEVFLAHHDQTGQPRAIKKISVLKFSRAKPMILNQISLLKSLDHPSILKIYQIFEEGQFEYIVTELCEGKELFDEIIERHYLPEEQACYIMYDLVSAVRCMHANRIMHRDLKPENVMYDRKLKTIRIIDFGSGVRFENSEVKARKRVGTVKYDKIQSYYIAPEVLVRNYNQKCDIWSLGVVLYVLLVGQPPFPGADDFKVMESIARGDPLRFRSNLWKKVSPKAKTLITKMLNRDIAGRPTAAQVMEDSWFQEKLLSRKLDKNQQRIVAYHLKNMQIYKDLQASALQEGMLIFIVNFVKDKNDEAEMARSFKALDLNGDGVISQEQLRKGLARYLGVPEARAEGLARQIFKKVDLNNSGAIDFSQFIMCASNIQLTVTEDNLDIAFDYIDTDASGKLSVQQIRDKLGSNISEQMYNNLLREFDVNNDGQISRQEFKVMMKVLVKKKKKQKLI